MPPVAVNVWEYDVLVVPAGNGELVVMDGAGFMVSASALFAVWDPVSVTSTVKLDVPAADGVPLITPVLDNVRPVGNVPDVLDHV